MLFTFIPKQKSPPARGHIEYILGSAGVAIRRAVVHAAAECGQIQHPGIVDIRDSPLPPLEPVTLQPFPVPATVVAAPGGILERVYKHDIRILRIECGRVDPDSLIERLLPALPAVIRAVQPAVGVPALQVIDPAAQVQHPVVAWIDLQVVGSIDSLRQLDRLPGRRLRVPVEHLAGHRPGSAPSAAKEQIQPAL